MSTIFIYVLGKQSFHKSTAARNSLSNSALIDRIHYIVRRVMRRTHVIQHSAPELEPTVITAVACIIVPIFVSLAVLSVYSVAAEESSSNADEAARVKKHAYIAAPAPVVAYSAAVPAAYSYAYSAYPYSSYSYSYPSAYAAPYAAPYAAYPSYAAYDDGKYYPGKYEKTYFPAYKTAYPYAYHY
uniref:Uncharacterized protein n=1 Tax=Sipha flava TaxID=143950 RepID=A0A2S2QDB3_9HEMI